MAFNIQNNIASSDKIVNLDAHYGPYNDLPTALTSARNFATNGLTVGVYEGSGSERKVVEYVFQGLVDGATPIGSNLVRKGSDAQITITQNGNDIGNFSLNQDTNTTINIAGKPLYWQEIS